MLATYAQDAYRLTYLDEVMQEGPTTKIGFFVLSADSKYSAALILKRDMLCDACSSS
jgi:hypothetical protein